MKRLLGIIVVLLASLIIGLSSCTNCAGNEPAVLKATVINVDNTIALDRQEMFLKFGEDYRWFETDILLPEFLDSENVTSSPEMVVNIFQSIVEKGNGADVWVHKFQHFKDGKVVHDSINGFWIEDTPLNNDTIKLNYIQAYSRVMEANFPKPHSKYITLRNPVGPLAINAQWVFGNIHEQLWVDAVTGDVKNSNPAFPDGFKMPLGEWP